MSNVHIFMIEDEHGDLVDIEYYHHACAPPKADEWPAPGSTDYPVFCLGCGKRIDEVPLTEHGKQEYG